MVRGRKKESASSGPRAMMLLAVLYVTQGVAPGFSVTALPVLLRVHGLSLSMVGLAGLLTWPWALKFLWGPIVDRFHLPGVGRRRSWIIPLQLVLGLGMVLIGLTDLDSGLGLVLVTVCAVNFVATVLDVATDALATELLPPGKRGIGNSAQIGGFYVGSIIGGGAFLFLEPSLGWTPSFALLGVVICVGVVAILLTKEPAPRPTEQRAHYWHFFARREAKYIIGIVVALNIGQQLANTTINLFLVDSGISKENIGFISGTVGLFAAMAGALIGGALASVLGHRRGLLIFGGCQAITVAGYFILSVLQIDNLWGVGAVICVQFAVANVFNVLLYACFMDWTSTRQTATDFSMMACIHNATSLVAAPVGGISAQHFGYSAHFLSCVVAAIAGLACAAWMIRKMGPVPDSDARSVLAPDSESAQSSPAGVDPGGQA